MMMLTGVTVTRQILAINKTLTRNGLRTLALLQERSDRVASSLLAPCGTGEAAGQHLWEQWSEAGQAGCKVVESVTDAYFEMLEAMLPPSGRPRR
jgi:hypothetical protein